jgi:NADH-quinone oxidoreductase subunit E
MTKSDIIKETDKIIDRFDGRPTGSVGILQDIQSKYNYLPQESLVRMSERLNIPLSQVFSLATFYKAFSLKPRGTHLVCVCMGTACHVRGASRVLDEVQRRLKIKTGETTEDGLFTLEAVNCLGACALGPLMVIDGEYYGAMSARKIDQVFKKYESSKKKK